MPSRTAYSSTEGCAPSKLLDIVKTSEVAAKPSLRCRMARGNRLTKRVRTCVCGDCLLPSVVQLHADGAKSTRGTNSSNGMRPASGTWE